MKRVLPLCLWLCLLVLGGFSDPAKGQTFARSYGLPDSREEGMSLLPLDSKTLLLAASKDDSTQLLFLDPDGNLLFHQSFKFSRNGLNDVVTSLKLDSENKVIAVGMGVVLGTNNYEGFAFRYDPVTRQLLWSNIWPDPSDGFGVLEYTPGQYMVFGEDRGTTGNGEDGLMAQMNPATGAISNAIQYGIGSSETFRSPVFWKNHFYTVGRFTLGPTNNFMRASMARLAVNGTVQQSRSFFVPMVASVRFASTDLAELDQDHLVMTAYGNPVGAPSRNVYLSMHDSLTVPVWGFRYDVLDQAGEIPHDVTREGDELIVMGSLLGARNTAFILRTGLDGSNPRCHSYPLYLRLPSGLSDNRMVVWNNSIYMTGTAPEAGGITFDNIGLIRANLDGSLSPECHVDTHLVDWEANTLSYSNGLTDSLSTVSDSLITLTPTVPPIQENPLCGDEPSPCFAADDSLFTRITNSVTLSGYQSWDGKMYLGDGVIVTIQGANSVLDLTNVDIVFGECAGINFVEGAQLRANNSVFRSCDPFRSWRGLRFEQADSSIVNTCTFKNAQQALHFVGSGDTPNPLTCRVSNNLFANNRIAMESSFMQMSGAVSGNTFLVDGQLIDFSPAACTLNPAYTDDHWGIRLIATEWRALISQNDFINGRGPDDAQDLYGIQAVLSSGTFSSNQFSNAFRGIELSACKGVTVENNQFETTQNFFDLENQIRASGNCSWLWITGNQLVNSNEDRSGMAGIYVDESAIVNIKENRVEGFAQGIQIRNLHTAQIAENELWNNLLYGIYQENGTNVDLNCNRIHMHYRPGQNAFGMGWFHRDGEIAGNQIRSNCVWDSQVALLTSSVSQSSLPLIRNNYFYNYEEAGILNMGCTGSIGTQINPISAAGRNTFRSNNTAATASNAAFDIFSTTTAITVNGNTGIRNVNANVFVNGSNLHGSTAACGNQAGNVNAEFLAGDICDTFDEQVAEVEGKILKSDFSVFEELSDKDVYRLSKAWMQHFISKGQGMFAQEIYNYGRGHLAAQYASILEIDNLWMRNEFLSARQKLTLNPGNNRMLELARIEDCLMQGKPLENAQIDGLQQWQHPQDAWGDHARDLLHLQAVRSDFRFREVLLPQFKLDQRRIGIEQAHFSIFPNPNSGNFNLEYVFPDGEGGRLEIYDSQGRRILQRNLKNQGGQEAVQLQELPVGIYLIRLSQEAKVLDSRKWIKIK